MTPSDADPATAVLVADLSALVAVESPSRDHEAVARSAEVVGQVGARVLGFAPERLVVDGCTHLRWRCGPAPTRVLLLGHHDTVWPLGSLARHPFDVTGGVLRGAGCFDMKAGVVMALHALGGLSAADRAGATLLVTGDEELGSPTSQALIESEARGAAAVLVLEGSADGGALKTSRKGAALHELHVTGRAAHAGLAPASGVNAAVELAHQILAVAALADEARDTTVTPTVAHAGTSANTVPASAVLTVDVRAWTATELARVDAALHALAPRTPGARLDVLTRYSRPPLEPTASAALFARASRLAAGLGLASLTGAAVGGGSDGNLTAGLGVPTLDGLGAVGGGAHAADEHVQVADLAPRTRLVSALVRELLEQGRTP